MLLDAAARSLKVHGFTDILFIGDSGGNQAGLTNVANKLNEEWKDTGVKVFALTDYYNAEPRSTIARGCRRVRVRRGDGRQPRRHHRHVADAVRPSGRRPQGSAQAVGRSRRIQASPAIRQKPPRRSARWESSSRSTPASISTSC